MRKFGYLPLIAILAALFVSSTNLYSQLLNDLNPTIGLFTTKLFANERNTALMAQSDSTANAFIGGSLDGVQPGIEVRFTIKLDDEDNFRIPVSFDYSFFQARERVNITQYLVARLQNSMNVLGMNAGFHYVLAHLRPAKANVYAGVEARFSFIHDVQFSNFLDYLVLNDSDRTTTYSKGNAFRIGGMATLGVDGRLRKDLNINLSGSVSIPNLLLRDNSRGELFTPVKLFETEESIVYQWHVSILLQYKF